MNVKQYTEMRKQPRITRSIYIFAETYRRLQAFAKSMGISVNAAIDLIVDQNLEPAKFEPIDKGKVTK